MTAVHIKVGALLGMGRTHSNSPGVLSVVSSREAELGGRTGAEIGQRGCWEPMPVMPILASASLLLGDSSR